MRIFVPVLLTIFLCVSLVGAQVKQAKFGLGALVGVSKMDGDIDHSTAGLTGGLLLTYSINKFFGLTATGTYGKMTSGVDAIKTRVFSTSLMGNFYLLPESPVKPFLSFGLTGFQYEATGGPADEPLFKEDGSAYKGWQNAFQLGLGLKLAASKQWAVTTMGNYTFSGVDDLDAISGGSNDGFFKGTLGLVHYFSRREAPAVTSRKRSEESWEAIERELDKSEAAASAPVTEPLPNTTSVRPKPATTGGIQFEPGTAKLLESSKGELDKIYHFLAKNPGESIELLGKSVKKQTSMNYQLVVDRARSIKSYLVSKGISPTRVIINSGD